MDKRAAITRDYGISIGQDSVRKITSVFNRVLASPDFKGDRKSIQELKGLFSEWSKYSSVRTSQIQHQLTETAEKLGIKILKGTAYEVTEENFSAIFDEKSAEKDLLSPELQQLRSSLVSAKVIVGADGAHSTVRKKVLGPDTINLVNQQTYGYTLEIKHEIATDSKNRPGMKDFKMASSYEGMVILETIGKPNPGTNLLPVTDLIYVDKETYEAFLEKNEKDEIVRGGPGKAWKMEELQEKATLNPIIKEYLAKIQNQIKRTQEICEADPAIEVKAPMIAALPLSIYRSKQSVKLLDNKIVTFVGDANSGLIIRRGLNKGLLEAALNAEAINLYVEDASDSPLEIPQPFVRYEQQAQKIFADEKWWIALKVSALDTVKKLLNYCVVPIYRPLFHSSENDWGRFCITA